MSLEGRLPQRRATDDDGFLRLLMFGAAEASLI